MGVVSYGSECPSYGVYARVTKVKHWIQFLAQGAEDSNCIHDIPEQQGNMRYIFTRRGQPDQTLQFDNGQKTTM